MKYAEQQLNPSNGGGAQAVAVVEAEANRSEVSGESVRFWCFRRDEEILQISVSSRFCLDNTWFGFNLNSRSPAAKLRYANAGEAHGTQPPLTLLLLLLLLLLPLFSTERLII